MPQPGKPNPRGEDWLVRKVQELEQKIQQLSAANPFRVMGIRPKDGGTDLDGFVNINGALEVNGASEFNGALEVNGVSEFNGALSINGPLRLQPGSIENDVLANPVDADTATAFSNTHGYTTTPTVIETASFTVPAGFTQAMVTCSAVAQGRNSTASADYLYVQAVIDGFTGGEIFTSAAAGESIAVTAPLYHVVTGLTAGQVLNASVMARTNTGAWATSSANLAIVYAQVLFLR